jgi:hypothetical protein
MIRPKQHHREVQYRPEAAKNLRQALVRFITREFPRLGGPWVIELFVDKLLEQVDTYRIARDRLQPGQTVWLAVPVEARPGYHKSMAQTPQVPVVLTLVNQEDIEDLRTNAARREVLKRTIVRAANDAYAQGGVLTCTDLGLLLHLSHNRIAELIRQYEAETGEIVPRRGTVHDLGRTVSHKDLICRKAYLEGKTTPVIARETFHSPEAVDHYILDFARVYFAVVQRGMSPEETAFAIQQPVSIVQQYIKLIQEFDLDEQQVYTRTGVQLSMCAGSIEPSVTGETVDNERREQEPIVD